MKSLSHVRLLPGSSVHGIFQARVLEWGAIAFYGPKYSLGKILFAWKQYIFFSFLNAMFYKSQLHLVGWMCLEILYYSDFFYLFFSITERRVLKYLIMNMSLSVALLFFQFS